MSPDVADPPQPPQGGAKKYRLAYLDVHSHLCHISWMYWPKDFPDQWKIDNIKLSCGMEDGLPPGIPINDPDLSEYLATDEDEPATDGDEALGTDTWQTSPANPFQESKENGSTTNMSGSELRERLPYSQLLKIISKLASNGEEKSQKEWMSSQAIWKEDMDLKWKGTSLERFSGQIPSGNEDGPGGRVGHQGWVDAVGVIHGADPHTMRVVDMLDRAGVGRETIAAVIGIIQDATADARTDAITECAHRVKAKVHLLSKRKRKE